MTNFEKYKDDLMEIDGEFAFNKNTGKIASCDSCIDCEDCVFNSSCLKSDKIKWLHSEYEEPIISNDELELIRVLGKINRKEYKYVSRDIYGVVRLFETKPHTNKPGYYSGEYTYVDSGTAGDKILFSNIKDDLYDIENNCFIKEEREKK